VRHDPPRIVWCGVVWTSETEVAMPPLPKPADLETITYAEGDRVCIDVVLDHVVVQTVTLSLAQLREHRQMTAERAALVAAPVTPGEPPLFDDGEDG
jgi:hypothetical protein